MLAGVEVGVMAGGVAVGDGVASGSVLPQALSSGPLSRRRIMITAMGMDIPMPITAMHRPMATTTAMQQRQPMATATLPRITAAIEATPTGTEVMAIGDTAVTGAGSAERPMDDLSITLTPVTANWLRDNQK